MYIIKKNKLLYEVTWSKHTDKKEFNLNIQNAIP